MKIIATTTTDKKTLYKMTKGAGIQRVQDNAGAEITVKNFVLYEDVKASGEVMEIVAVEASDGTMIASNSPTFKDSFMDICTICGDPADMVGETVKIESGKSKAGRTFFTCVWV